MTHCWVLLAPPKQEAYVPGFREGRLLHRVQPSIYSAKASHAQLPDMLLRSGTQALRIIARIPLIQRRKKSCSCEEKVPSRSGFSLSLHVVLKTRYISPNIHVRRY